MRGVIGGGLGGAGIGAGIGAAVGGPGGAFIGALAGGLIGAIGGALGARGTATACEEKEPEKPKGEGQKLVGWALLGILAGAWVSIQIISRITSLTGVSLALVILVGAFLGGLAAYFLASGFSAPRK